MPLKKSNIGFVQTSSNILEQLNNQYIHQSNPIDNYIYKINKLCNEPLNLAVMGEFNAGKSSFINKLLGFDILPTGIVPKTATIIKVKYSTEPKIEIHYNIDGKTIVEKTNDITKIKIYQNAKNINKEDIAKKIESIDEIIVYTNNILLKNFTFIDTPGFNHDEKMNNTTRSIYKDIDIVIWLITKNQASKKTEVEELLKLKENVDNIMLIVNKSDINSEDEDEEQIRENIKQNFSKIISNPNSIHFISSKKNIDDKLELKFQNLLYELKHTALEDDVKISEELLKKEFKLFGLKLNENLQEWKVINKNLSLILDNNYTTIDTTSMIADLRVIIKVKLENLISKLNEINSSYNTINNYSKTYIVEEFFETTIQTKISNIHRDGIQIFMNKVFEAIEETISSSKLDTLKEKEEILIALSMIKAGLIRDVFSSLGVLGAIKYYINSELLKRNILDKILKSKIENSVLEDILLVYKDDIAQAIKIISNNKYITLKIEDILEFVDSQIKQIKNMQVVLKGVPSD